MSHYNMIEQYRHYLKEQITGILYSLLVVVLVVAFVTLNLKITVLVTLAITLVDFYLIGLIHYADLTLNNFTGINMIFALGLAVDYSTHIAHTYLLTEPLASC